MRRQWLTGAVLATFLTLGLTGCGLPAGVDGDLIDDWAAIVEPVAFVPEAGTCHPTFQKVGYRNDYRPVECTEAHTTETVHVGTLTGENADEATPPALSTTGLRPVRADCEKRANELLGGPWRAARLTVTLVLPSPEAWSGGARWYRCDLNITQSLDNPEPIPHNASLKDELTGPSDLAHGCFQPRTADKKVNSMEPVSCTTKHQAEFVGIWMAPDSSYAAMERDNKRQHGECLKLVGIFTKVPQDSNLKYRSGTILYYPNRDSWDAGDRGIRCFLWFDDRQLTKSLKGAGTKGLPIRYA